MHACVPSCPCVVISCARMLHEVRAQRHTRAPAHALWQCRAGCRDHVRHVFTPAEKKKPVKKHPNSLRDAFNRRISIGGTSVSAAAERTVGSCVYLCRMIRV
ncbi:hypothetical protein QQF64_033229 [Cirrhinus molitorella]|uniref:Secreted protein n=1 Tax=Cirrhinus molitorella TaxID=172907 RepID=A0ABR3MTB3_9TELE